MSAGRNSEYNLGAFEGSAIGYTLTGFLIGDREGRGYIQIQETKLLHVVGPPERELTPVAGVCCSDSRAFMLSVCEHSGVCAACKVITTSTLEHRAAKQ